MRGGGRFVRERRDAGHPVVPRMRRIPTNHSPFFAPLIHPTIEVGVTAMVTAAREFLD
jgi:hypothetical protein